MLIKNGEQWSLSDTLTMHVTHVHVQGVSERSELAPCNNHMPTVSTMLLKTCEEIQATSAQFLNSHFQCGCIKTVSVNNDDH